MRNGRGDLKYFTVKDIAELLSVSEETVRRWIRDGKLDAERGVGRQGSKVEEKALKDFLEKNKIFLTGAGATALGIASIIPVVGSTLGAIGLGAATAAVSGPFAAALLGMSWLTALKQSQSDKKAVKEELETKKLELEGIIMQLKFEIASRQNELDLAQKQLEKVNEILKSETL